MGTRIGPKGPWLLYLQQWREKRGLTQQQLADRVGTSDSTIQRWEQGKRKPDADAMKALAYALDTTPQRLWEHPDRPSADELLRNEAEDVVDTAIKMIRAIKRRA